MLKDERLEWVAWAKERLTTMGSLDLTLASPEPGAELKQTIGE